VGGKKPWYDLSAAPADHVRKIFNAVAKVVVGSGERTLFWSDRWINGKAIDEFAPDIVDLVNPLTKARRPVAQALASSRWINDIKNPITINYFSPSN
jgi:hypothetical protein